MTLHRDRAELERRIASFRKWHYAIDIDGITTPAPAGHDEWHRQRAERVLPALLEALGGLRGSRVLDLGCNAGYWSMLALEAGCDLVLAVDAVPEFLAQAELVLSSRGFDPRRYTLSNTDVFALDPAEVGTFDVVLCLGLLYHVTRPVELFTTMGALCSSVLMIDTQVTPGEDAGFKLWHHGGPIGSPFALRPTVAAVHELAIANGFNSVVPLGAYHDGKRAAFLCSK